MKKLSFLIFVVLSLIANVKIYASNDTPNSETTPVDLEIRANNPGTGENRHRTPLYVDITVSYVSSKNSIEINYNGEAIGEVFVYNGPNLVAFTSELNTSILLPSSYGSYEIEIITDVWSARGYLDL